MSCTSADVCVYLCVLVNNLSAGYVFLWCFFFRKKFNRTESVSKVSPDPSRVVTPEHLEGRSGSFKNRSEANVILFKEQQPGNRLGRSRQKDHWSIMMELISRILTMQKIETTHIKEHDTFC